MCSTAMTTSKSASPTNIEGKFFEHLPDELEVLSNCRPHYIDMDGWQESTVGVTAYEELPEAACAYIEELSQRLELPVSIISTGSGREQRLLYETLRRSSVSSGLPLAPRGDSWGEGLVHRQAVTTRKSETPLYTTRSRLNLCDIGPRWPLMAPSGKGSVQRPPPLPPGPQRRRRDGFAPSPIIHMSRHVPRRGPKIDPLHPPGDDDSGPHVSA